MRHPRSGGPGRGVNLVEEHEVVEKGAELTVGVKGLVFAAPATVSGVTEAEGGCVGDQSAQPLDRVERCDIDAGIRFDSSYFPASLRLKMRLIFVA